MVRAFSFSLSLFSIVNQLLARSPRSSRGGNREVRSVRSLVPGLVLAVLGPAADAVRADSELPEPRRFEVRRNEEPIEIDGVLDDPGWRGATLIDMSYEWLPGNNVAPPVRTDSWVTYDQRHLYVAWRCHDPEPGRIRAHLMDRDDLEILNQDDHVMVTIDSFDDQRRGFQFRVNPLGVQADAVFNQSAGGEDFSFDMIWESAGRIDDRGYVVEIAIPFAQLRFPRDRKVQTWGFDLQRFYPRNARHRISSEAVDRNDNCRLCRITRVSGFEGMSTGRNLEVTPTVTALRTERDSQSVGEEDRRRDSEDDSQLGLSVRWGPSPDLSVNATINPDFSQVEADAAQLDVNRRFALFFEEKRPFFLEGGDLFATPINAVFTRTVVDPDWGLKLTGKLQNNVLAVFAARDSVNSLLIPGNQSSSQAFLEEETDSGAFRYRRDVGRSSSLGAIWTVREGTHYQNHVYGADAFLRIDSRNTLQLQYLRSETAYPEDVAEDFGQASGSFADDAFLVGYNYDSSRWDSWFWLEDRGRGFRADSGFVPQVDLRAINTGVQRTIWGDDRWFDRLSSFVRYRRSEDHSGRLSLESMESSTFIEGPLQTLASFGLWYGRERLREVVHDDLAGGDLSFSIQPSGDVRLAMFAGAGDGLDLANNQVGDQLEIEPSIDWKIGRPFSVELDHVYSRLDVPGGRLFEVHLSQLGLVYNFNVRSFLRLILQYEDLRRDPTLHPFDVGPSEQTLFTQILYSYKLNPQTVLFAGYSENRLGRGSLDPTDIDRTLFFKAGYAWLP